MMSRKCMASISPKLVCLTILKYCVMKHSLGIHPLQVGMFIKTLLKGLKLTK